MRKFNVEIHGHKFYFVKNKTAVSQDLYLNDIIKLWNDSNELLRSAHLIEQDPALTTMVNQIGKNKSSTDLIEAVKKAFDYKF